MGAVVFIDTGGLDDKSKLSSNRIRKARNCFDKLDVVVLVTEPDIWTEYEEQIIAEFKSRNVPVIIAVNKIDKKYRYNPS